MKYPLTVMAVGATMTVWGVHTQHNGLYQIGAATFMIGVGALLIGAAFVYLMDNL